LGYEPNELPTAPPRDILECKYAGFFREKQVSLLNYSQYPIRGIYYLTWPNSIKQVI
jgi:hypothetical protein